MPDLRIQTREVGDYQALTSQLNISPKMAQILSSRGIRTLDQIDYSVQGLISPDGMPDIGKAAKRIAQAIENGERILICGDFDADGATASSLCMLFFRAIGYEHADFRVPDRFKLGYGLTEQFVQKLLEDSPDLLITVDNGVSSIDGVALANQHGIDVIVTDHHLPSSEKDGIPDAFAIVNPHMPDSTFSSAPCGVGVAFYLLAYVRKELINRGYFEKVLIDPPKLTEWLDIVALGTVVDMVPLDLNNRRLVNEGLRRMRSGRARPGIRALCEVSNTDIKTLSTQDLGFKLGPRINAAGRLEDISIGIRLLLAEDSDEAFGIAMRLQAINTKRRETQQEMNEDARQMLIEVSELDRRGYCLYLPSFHEGVVGLVATEVVRKRGRPAIVFANADAELDSVPLLKGSARSINGIHIRDILALLATRYPKLIHRFGGHAAAAGLTIAERSFDRFSQLFEELLEEEFPASAFEDAIETDGQLRDEEISLNFVDEINQFEPWGQAFPKPTFHGTFSVISEQSIGRGGVHQKYVLKQGDGKMVEAIAFNQPKLDAREITATFELNRNSYQGTTVIQLILDKIVVNLPG